MSEVQKEITREQLYEEVWRTPLTTLAKDWGIPISGIVQACVDMNVPRPGTGHWQLLRKGRQVERAALPPMDTKTLATAVIIAAQKRQKAVRSKDADKSAMGDLSSKVEIPHNLDNVHRLVKQTHKALVAGKLNKGFLEKSWGSKLDQPFRVMVSPGQLIRALRILAAIVKGVVERGGRFEQGPESWRLRLFIGKQPINFYMRETMKRHNRHFTEEEQEAKGFSLRDKYDWEGSGKLWFKIEYDKYVRERIWEESRGLKLEDQVGEIIDVLANAETVAGQMRTAEAEWQRQENERHQREAIERRRQEDEKQQRKVLEECSERWHQARRLRCFIRA